jgi:polyhydroxybutyrate depolymerase
MRPLVASLLLASCGSQPHWPAGPPADPCGAAAFPDEPMVLEVAWGDRTRRALVWFPPTPGPHDVVVDLHEFRSDPMRQAHYSMWVPHAREVGAILVAPDGRAATWNAGGCCGKAHEESTDDVGLLDAVVASVEAHGCTTGFVLATGIGNGGMMAERWAWSSAVPDAVVSVGGALQRVDDAPVGARPVPVLHYHGADDPFFPASGASGKALIATRPVADATAAWVARGAMQPLPPLEDGDLRCERWAPAGAAEPWVQSCTVAGMIDAWPRAADTQVTSGSPLADATRGAWAWAKAVTRP